MAAAYFLSRKCEVTLFEKEERLGGHTHTHRLETEDGFVSLDTGFLVHNDHTYPNLVRLFQELHIERQMSDMSFGVSCAETGFEYSSRGLRGFFATRSTALRPAHYRFLAEIMRFNRQARAMLESESELAVTLAEFLERRNFSKDFTRHYLYPMASAVWSTSLEDIREFPARTLIQFFDNHGFLGLSTQHQWYTLRGGNSSYIPALIEPYRERIRRAAQIEKITRHDSGVHLHFAGRPPESFDEIVLACHAPQALALLADPTQAEREILSCFQTSRNEALLHTDSSLLPRRKWARASWNYHVGAGEREVAVTYHLNRLQGLQSNRDYCLTLNRTSAIAPEKILKRLTYWHPLFTRAAVQAQKRWAEISGKNHTHFCGAYWLYGFHEDGLNSALRVAGRLGAEWPQGERDGVRNLHRDVAASPVFAGAPPVHLPAVHGAAGY